MMKAGWGKKILLRIARTAAAGLVLAAIACALLLPLPHSLRSQADAYECTWQDGSVTSESYASAYRHLAGVEQGDIVLEKEGRRGRIASGAVAAAEETLRNGELNELLSADFSALAGMERAAIFRAFENTLYYSHAEYFAFNGSGMERVRRNTAHTLVLLSGAVSNVALRETGARELIVHKNATLSPKSLVGTAVCAFGAKSPYMVRSDALYLETPGGTRLVAALPSVRSLEIADVEFYDEGALLACENLTHLTLPYLNTAKYNPADGGASLARLFSDGEEFFVPDTLQSVSVTGGRIAPLAFYNCSAVEEINLCGVPAKGIDANAFVSVTSLRILHTPQALVALPFTHYSVSTAPCGCTVYVRTES